MDDEADPWGEDEGEVVLEEGQSLDFVDYDGSPLFRVTVIDIEDDRQFSQPAGKVKLHLQRASS